MSGNGTRPFEAGDAVTLSTGQTLELPVTTEATMTAAIVPADREQAARLLPSGLSPVRAGRGTAAIWLLSVEYHDIDHGALDPYNEFAVVITATHGPSEGIPYLSPLLRNEGYVWYMPVTTEPARAFGDEIWSFPKVVADVDIEETDGRRRTTVAVDGQHLITLEVERPPTFARDDTLTAYTVQDETLLSIPGELSCEMGMWPYSSGFSYTLGDHPKAEELRKLDLGERAFTRFYADGEVTFGPGEPLDR